MEVHYKREMKHNYLIVEPDEGNKPGYEARMLMNNAVEGLLRFHIKYMDERQSYYYDITSMQPLGRILQNRFIDRGEICQLLIQLHVALRRMEDTCFQRTACSWIRITSTWSRRASEQVCAWCRGWLGAFRTA